MSTIDSEWERLGFLRSKGRGQEKCHIVLIEEEARARVENAGPKPKTRFAWELDTAEGYSDMNAGKDRLLRIVGNKQVAISIGARLWLETDEEVLREMAEG